ncbi:LysR substrate-binding domain-containing protein [Longimicrobium sp.]|uniref:LysR substrate-binding domain-containing protein n=1 Tax=Longimicrobium sp. TaxID=2029185 RepID=UPI002C08DDB3|nr:LysR substrate-binding domain-containing protein [Longimicrobium sp.]HSU13921.1 LysR substrate-binding domain-containing protein [Longimicrobium sp.]
MNRTPELRHLRYFVAVAEELHFGRAAERLGIQQPPLTQQIQRLEAVVGAPLLVRRPRVQLTEAGRVLLAHARRLIAQADRGMDEARRAARGESGVLAVGFAASTLPALLATAIRAFRDAAPGVELRLRELPSAAHAAALRDGTIDVSVAREPPPEEGIAREVLMDEELVAVLPPGHALAGSDEIALAALADEPFVHFHRAVAPGLHDRVAALCRAAGFEPRIVQQAHEWLTIVGLVEAGLGVTLAPASFRRLRWGGVAYAALTGPADRTTLVALCHRADDLPPAGERFAAALRDAARARG